MAKVTELTRDEIVVLMGEVVLHLNTIVQDLNPAYKLIVTGRNSNNRADISMGERLYPFTTHRGDLLNQASLSMGHASLLTRAHSLRDLSARVAAGQLNDADAATALRELFAGMASDRLGKDQDIYAHATACIEAFKVESNGTLSYAGNDAKFIDDIVIGAIKAHRDTFQTLPSLDQHHIGFEFVRSQYCHSIGNGGPLTIPHCQLQGFLDVARVWRPKATPTVHQTLTCSI